MVKYAFDIITVKFRTAITAKKNMMPSPTMTKSLTLPLHHFHCSSVVIIWICFWSHLSRCFTHASFPHLPIQLWLPSPSTYHLVPSSSLLSNCVQHYTGGSWVRRQTRCSGEWCKSHSNPFLFLLFFLPSTPNYCLLDVLNACLLYTVCLLCCYPCLS